LADEIRIAWSDDDHAYIATSPRFRRLAVVADTPAEAEAEFRMVEQVAIEIYAAEGWPLPSPQKAGQ
jgi:predicted RNase H-like HicB family nuclease